MAERFDSKGNKSLTKGSSEDKAKMILNNHKETPFSWLIRVLKGVLVGIGAILPGISGGVLMVIFKIYDALIDFLGNFPKNLIKYFFFFLPVGIGGLLGIFLFSGLVSAAFGTYVTLFVSLFIGFVAGTVPSLWQNAGEKGRGAKEYIALFLSSFVIIFFMLSGEKELTAVEPNFLIWIGGGILVGLGFIVPGLSPSNFLIYFGMYSKMTDGIKALDFSVIIPLIIGVAIAVIAFAKLVSILFERFYGIMYHIIVGTVLGSSVAIFPTVVAPGFTKQGLSAMGLTFVSALLWVIILFCSGMIASLLFGMVEERYSPEKR
jgi:putative membrane protein